MRYLNDEANEMNLNDVIKFLDEHDTCVLATVSADGKPQSATVGFSFGDDFSILIGTNKETRKYHNLQTNTEISLVVGVTGPKTVQYEGIVKEVTAEDLSGRLNRHFQKVPGAKRFVGDSGQRYFLITPTWLRFTDYTAPIPIFETKDFL